MQAFRNLARNTFRTSGVTTRCLATEAADNAGLNFTFTSSSETFFDSTVVNQVNVPSTDGDLGILANHVPVIGTLKPGVVSVFGTDNKETKYFVSSGTLTVNADSTVQIIAEEAVTLDNLDANEARRQLDQYTSLANSSSGTDKATAEIGVEVYSAMVKALE